MPASSTDVGRAPVVAMLVTFAVTAGVLLGVVLPAVYGVNPLAPGRHDAAPPREPAATTAGTTATTGATTTAPAAAATAVKAAAGPLFPQAAVAKSDAREFDLGPYGSAEFGYTLDKDATLIYAWTSSAPLSYDFHTEPAGKPPDSSDSFEMADGSEGHGGYVAPYAGIHGWYWENKTDGEVKLTLTATGFFTKAILYNTDDGSSKSVPITPSGTRGRVKSE